MANWLNDPAVKALLPHSKLIEEAFGLTSDEATTPVVHDRKDWAARRQSPRALARKSHQKASAARTAKRDSV